MTIPVKELLDARKNSVSGVSLYYVAEGRAEGQKLVAVGPVKKTNT
jgi:hypothetical protein